MQKVDLIYIVLVAIVGKSSPIVAFLTPYPLADKQLEKILKLYHASAYENPFIFDLKQSDAKLHQNRNQGGYGAIYRLGVLDCPELFDCFCKVRLTVLWQFYLIQLDGCFVIALV